MPTNQPAAGTDLVLWDRATMTYQYRPGWGGRLQRPSTPGYHALSHGGAITGVSLADFEQSRVIPTQAGGVQRMANIYNPEYQGK